MHELLGVYGLFCHHINPVCRLVCVCYVCVQDIPLLPTAQCGGSRGWLAAIPGHDRRHRCVRAAVVGGVVCPSVPPGAGFVGFT